MRKLSQELNENEIFKNVRRPQKSNIKYEKNLSLVWDYATIKITKWHQLCLYRNQLSDLLTV